METKMKFVNFSEQKTEPVKKAYDQNRVFDGSPEQHVWNWTCLDWVDLNFETEKPAHLNAVEASDKVHSGAKHALVLDISICLVVLPQNLYVLLKNIIC